MCAKGQSLIDRGHYASKEIRAKIKQLQNNWMKLRELLITRSERLKDAAQSLQVCQLTKTGAVVTSLTGVAFPRIERLSMTITADGKRQR